MLGVVLPVLCVWILHGASGVETEVSVMEGDSVALHTSVKTDQQSRITWYFNGFRIVQITGDLSDICTDVWCPERFRDRLELDQTGSLTVINIRTTDSGDYTLQIISSSSDSEKIFSVTVQDVPAAERDDVKSVKEGESVTLHPGEINNTNDLITWYHNDILIAEITGDQSQICTDERFRGRLELDQTGSLTIRNTRTTDSGLYQLQIRGSGSLQKFILTVSQPGLCPGDKAGIVVGVLLFVAAAAVGVIYYRRKISELRIQVLLSVTVKEGGDVTLKPNNKINTDDEILWMFEDEEQLIHRADIRREPRQIVINDYAAGGRFRGRLKLDETTGSLIIGNSRAAHSGLYTLHITSSRGDSEQRFILTVNENVEVKSVEGGESVTLDSGPEIHRDDLILWMFGDQDSLIAQIRGGTVEIYDGAAGEIFRDRLKLNETGSLTIRDITSAHTGLYTLQTFSSSSRGILCKKFRVLAQLKRVPVTAGDPVHLSTDRPKLERKDVIEWMFGDKNSLIAEVKGGTRRTYDGPDERFRDRLELNKSTGDLTIKNSTAQHKGHYILKICSRRGNTNKIYSVIITDSSGKRENESETVEMLLQNK